MEKKVKENNTGYEEKSVKNIDNKPEDHNARQERNDKRRRLKWSPRDSMIKRK